MKKIIIFIFLFLFLFINISCCLPYCEETPTGNTCPCLHNPCGTGATCVDNGDGSFDCTCPNYYQEYDYQQRVCFDPDECSLGNGDCAQGCTNVPGSTSPSCYCNTGYKLIGSKNCEDINECQSSNGGCSQNCINTAGSYYCSCNSGYSIYSDGKTCVDNNECQSNNGGCSQNCINTAGGYYCSCNSGYTLSADTKSCADVNECQSNNGGCSQNCINTVGSYYCSCNSGYSLSSDTKTCVDVNECQSNNGGCSQNCINTAGGYYCSCNSGYALSADTKSCADVNECQSNNGGCSQNCINTVGSSYCTCNNGYTLSGDNKSCGDVNECQSNNGGCSQNCINTAGSYYCNCNSDYRLNADGKTCEYNGPIDPCLGNNCQGICTASNSGFTCSCPSGYTLDINGYGCNDNDECLSSNGGCSQNCINTIGSSYCTCNSGYTLSADSKSCISNCQGNKCEGSCNPLNIGYSCSCSTGYSLAGDNFGCIDNDECLSLNGGCSQNCVNTPGYYHCSCNSGFTLNVDGKTCDTISGCSTGNGGCSQNCNNLSGGTFQCSCNKGYELNNDGKQCDDINECQVDTPCSIYSKCQNVIGSYLCIEPQQHYISSIKPSTTNGGPSNFYGSFGNEHQDISLTIGNKDCTITYISPDLINCTSLAGFGKHQVNLTQNGISFTNIDYVYEAIGNKVCKNNCTNELQGICNTLTSECNCKEGWNGFDCSQKSITSVINDNGGDNSTIPPTNITISNGQTNIANQEVNFQIYFKSLNEIDYSGKIIKTYTLKDNWKLNESLDDKYKFIQKLTSNSDNCTLETIIEQVKEDKQFLFADTSFTVLKGLVKFTISILNYQYSSSLNTLQLELISMVDHLQDSNFNNHCNNNDTQIETTNDDHDNQQQQSYFNYIKISKNNKIFSARFLNRIISDGKASFLSSVIKNDTSSSSSSSEVIVSLNLPHCVKECTIDPDFSVLVSSDFKSKCDSNSRRWVTPVSVVLSITGAAAIGVAGFMFYKKSTVLKVKMHKLKRLGKK